MERVLDLIAVLALLALYVWGFADADSLPASVMRPIEISAAVAVVVAIALMAVMWVLATHPERIGHVVFRVARVLPHAMADRLAGLARTFSSGFAVAREPRALGDGASLVDSALGGHFRRGMARDDRVWHRHAVFGNVPAAGASRDWRRGADAWGGGQLSRGLSIRRDDVLRRAERRRGGRRDRDARDLVHTCGSAPGWSSWRRMASASAACGTMANAAPKRRCRLSHEVPVLRSSGRQGRRLAREQGGRSDSPPARVSRLRPPLHQLRADRRDPVHGDQEGRQPRTVRAPEAHRRSAQGVREASRQRGGGGGGGGSRRGERCRSARRRR